MEKQKQVSVEEQRERMIQAVRALPADSPMLHELHRYVQKKNAIKTAAAQAKSS